MLATVVSQSSLLNPTVLGVLQVFCLVAMSVNNKVLTRQAMKSRSRTVASPSPKVKKRRERVFMPACKGPYNLCIYISIT